MINLEEVLSIHRTLIEEFGGTEGIRDISLLKSALNRPFLGLLDTPFYPTPEEKAAALLESLVQNHPFIDGNKRIAYTLFRLMLLHYGKDIIANESDKYDFIIGIAKSELNFNDILSWTQNNINQI